MKLIDIVVWLFIVAVIVFGITGIWLAGELIDGVKEHGLKFYLEEIWCGKEGCE